MFGIIHLVFTEFGEIYHVQSLSRGIDFGPSVLVSGTASDCAFPTIAVDDEIDRDALSSSRRARGDRTLGPYTRMAQLRLMSEHKDQGVVATDEVFTRALAPMCQGRA